LNSYLAQSAGKAMVVQSEPKKWLNYDFKV